MSFYISLPVCAASLGGDVAIEADNTYFDVDGDVFYAENHVVLTSPNMTLTADKLSFKLKEESVHAEGGVHFNQGDLAISAQGVDYNLAKKEGSFLDIATFYDGWYYYGAVLEIKPQLITIKNACITRCAHKHYQFKASRVEIYNWEAMRLQWAGIKFLWLPGIPLPNLYFNFKKNHLWPGISLGYNQDDGAGISGGFSNALAGGVILGTDLSFWSESGWKGSVFCDAELAGDHFLRTGISASKQDETYWFWTWKHEWGRQNWEAEYQSTLDGISSEGSLKFTRNLLAYSKLSYQAGLVYHWGGEAAPEQYSFYNSFNITDGKFWKGKVCGAINTETLVWDDIEVKLWRRLCCIELGVSWEKDRGWGLTMGLQY
ncbi:MAG: hypothetical protein ACM3WV_09105 [Bacillota bacterium]